MNERNKKKNCQIENRSDVFVIDLRKKKKKKEEEVRVYRLRAPPTLDRVG